ncbi:MAG: uncharacterized protein V7637_2592 [Mycobacteriales bacterium]
MTDQPVPYFRYHPDPVGTGNVVARDIVCGVCQRARTHAYIGPYVSPDFHYENEDPLCPWCIADGSAAREWQASFTAPAYLSGEARAGMPAERLAELEFRTPSFRCLQQDRWLDHHGEADEYLGEVGADEFLRLPAEAQVAVRAAAGDAPDRPLADDDTVLTLRADGDGPAVYLFRCLHCGRYDGFFAAG